MAVTIVAGCWTMLSLRLATKGIRIGLFVSRVGMSPGNSAIGLQNLQIPFVSRLKPVPEMLQGIRIGLFVSRVGMSPGNSAVGLQNLQIPLFGLVVVVNCEHQEEFYNFATK